jgi:hypothetical protein
LNCSKSVNASSFEGGQGEYEIIGASIIPKLLFILRYH